MKIDDTTITELVQGSRNINQMKKEIEHFFRMLAGLVGKEVWGDIDGPHGLSRRFPFFDRDKDCGYWRLDGGNKRLIYVICYIDGPMGQEVGYRMGPSGREFPRTDRVQTVYDNLDAFLAGMIGLDPELEKRLLPFLDAAKVQL